MSPSNSMRDFTEYVGRFLWPRTTADLTDTTLCPACRTPLQSPVCASCGLDLRHPAAIDLLAASTDAAAALDKRVQLIGQIRYEVAENAASARALAEKRALERVAEQALAEQTASAHRHADARAAAQADAERAATQAATAAAARITAALAAAPAAQTVAAPPVSHQPASASWSAPAGSPASAATATPPPASTRPAEASGPAPHKRSSVQIVLLLVGVTLVSVAAIFFLTVAWILTGLAFRSSVVAVFTLGTLVTAALLRRKRLVATAEGIGALAVVLVLLDVWAMRQNNLFGFGERDGLLYWGAALAVCTVLFLGWHAWSSLRVASVAGFAAAAPAVGLLAAGLAADATLLTRVFVALSGAAAGALLHRFTVPGSAGFWPTLNRRAERLALLLVAGLALLTAAGLATVVLPDSAWAPLLTFGIVAILATAHVATVLSTPEPDAFSRTAAYAAAGLAALTAVLGVVVSTWRSESANLIVAVPVLVAVTLALGFELVWRHLLAGTARRVALTGAVTAAALAGLSGLSVLLVAAVPLLRALVADDPDPIARVSSEATSALAALVGVGLLVSVFWRLGGVLRARRRVLAWFGVALVLLAVPFTQWLWLIVPLYLLLGALALAALFLARSRRPELGPFRPHLVTLFALAETLGYVLGWSGSSSWWVGTLSAVLALVLARLLLDPQTRSGGRGALLAGAIVLTLVGAAAAPRGLTLAAPPTAAVLWLHLLLAVAVTTGVLQVFIAQSRFGRLTPMERRWAFWTLLAPTVYLVAAPTGRVLEDLPADERATVALLAPAAGILAAALVAGAMLLWTVRPAPRLGWERATAALLVAPALFALATDLVLVTDAPATVTSLTAPTATLLTVALALALRVTGRTSRSALGLEIGAGIVLATAFLPLDRVELGWLMLLLTAVAVLITAVDADGLFASGSWRRHLGWISLVLATTALWWGLASGGTTPLEAYVLPLAGTLLALAALLWRFGRVDRAVAASPGAALLTFAGLSVALLPLALAGQTGSVLRPVIVGTLSAVLLLGATLLRWTPPRWAFLAAAGLAGALGVLVTGVARSLREITAGDAPGFVLEAWLLPATVLLAAAAVLLVRQDHPASRPARMRAALALMLVALVALTVLETSAFDPSGLGAARAIGLVLLLCVLHVFALLRRRVPFGTVTAWCSAVLAGVAAVTALFADAVDPFELVLVPLGVALVAGQLLRNRPWSPEAGTAAHGLIGVGLALTLLPSAVVAAGPGASTVAATGLPGDAIRQLLTLALGGVLAAGGAVLLGRPRWSLLAWPAVLVGSASIVVTAAGRIQPLLETSPAGPAWQLEAWLLPATLLLIGTGALVILRGRPPAESPAPRLTAPVIATGISAAIDPVRVLGYGLVLLALVGILWAETGALTYPPYAEGRMILLIALFAVLHLAVRWVDRSVAGTLLAWGTIAAGLLALLLGLRLDLPTPFELGTVPLGLSLAAGQLLALGLLGRRPDRPGASGAAGESRPAGQAWLAVGLAVAILPSAVGGADGALARPVLSLTLGGAVAVLGALLVNRPRWHVLAWPSVLVGIAAVVVTAGARILPLYRGPAGPLGQLEAWLLPAAGLVVATGVCLVWAARAASPAGAAPDLPGATAPVVDRGRATRFAGTTLAERAGYGLVIAAMGGVVLAELPALDHAPLAAIRVVLIVWTFSALYLGAFWADPSALGRLVAWVTLGGAAAMVVAGWTQAVPDPVEIVSIPLALALVASGLLHLDRTPSARSWVALAPGLLVLLVPSLLLDLSYSPLWRVVGLGVLALAVLLIGTARKLQAPFLIGAVVLLIHGVAQLWPWISLTYDAVPWWLWLGVGGVLLIVLAARYEQRIQNLKSVALRISALR